MFYPCLFCPSDNFEHCLVLPTHWRASVHALFYWYLLCDPRRCEINRKVRAPRHASESGAPHVVTWTKQTWTKHHNTLHCCYTTGHTGHMYLQSTDVLCWPLNKPAFVCWVNNWRMLFSINAVPFRDKEKIDRRHMPCWKTERSRKKLIFSCSI